MDFGRLPDASLVDFRLPPETPRSLELLKRVGGGGKPRLLWGAPVWGRKEWVGRIYPKGAKPARFLYHYSRRFPSIELNSTFYGIPDAATVDRWRTTVPDGFRFCPKLPQAVSHDAARLDTREAFALTEAFTRSVSGLRDRLGTCFLQLGPAFSPDRLAELARWLGGAWPRELPLAVELRHPGWFGRGALASPACDVLERAGAAAVITDVCGRRDVSHGSLTAPRAFVRFVGDQLAPTDFRRLDDWSERLERWASLGVSEISFFVHQPDDVDAPPTLDALVERLRPRLPAAVGWWTPAPAEAAEKPANGEQMTLF